MRVLGVLLTALLTALALADEAFAWNKTTPASYGYSNASVSLAGASGLSGSSAVNAVMPSGNSTTSFVTLYSTTTLPGSSSSSPVVDAVADSSDRYVVVTVYATASAPSTVTQPGSTVTTTATVTADVTAPCDASLSLASSENTIDAPSVASELSPSLLSTTSNSMESTDTLTLSVIRASSSSLATISYTQGSSDSQSNALSIVPSSTDLTTTLHTTLTTTSRATLTSTLSRTGYSSSTALVSPPSGSSTSSSATNVSVAMMSTTVRSSTTSNSSQTSNASMPSSASNTHANATAVSESQSSFAPSIQGRPNTTAGTSSSKSTKFLSLQTYSFVSMSSFLVATSSPYSNSSSHVMSSTVQPSSSKAATPPTPILQNSTLSSTVQASIFSSNASIATLLSSSGSNSSLELGAIGTSASSESSSSTYPVYGSTPSNVYKPRKRDTGANTTTCTDGARQATSTEVPSMISDLANADGSTSESDHVVTSSTVSGAPIISASSRKIDFTAPSVVHVTTTVTLTPSINVTAESLLPAATSSFDSPSTSLPGVSVNGSESTPTAFIPFASVVAISTSSLIVPKINTTENFLASPLSTSAAAPVWPSQVAPGTISGSTLEAPNATTLATSTRRASIVAPASNASIGASPTPSVCGEYGDFTLTWDDSPSFTPPKGTNHSFTHPPIFNPYKKLFFANGYGYIDETREPFKAESAPTLVVYDEDHTADRGSPYAEQQPGYIGSGPRAPFNEFWFNAYGGFFGCPYQGPGGFCTLQITGMRYDQPNETEMPWSRQTAQIPTCPGFKDCELHHVPFTADFQNISSIMFNMMIPALPRILQNQDFMLDNLELGWSNNSCAAGLFRLTAR